LLDLADRDRIAQIFQEQSFEYVVKLADQAGVRSFKLLQRRWVVVNMSMGSTQSSLDPRTKSICQK
jgi:hypothetical protein